MLRILIPTDFSDNAINALKYALKLFKHEAVDFYFLHAYEDEVYNDKKLVNKTSYEDIIDVVRTQAQTHLESYLKLANTVASNSKYTYHTIASYNSLIDEVDKIVTGKDIDLIVMGTRGKTNDRSLTFGSQTLQVLKYVECPVLGVPEHYQYQKPKHILFPTNFMMPYKKRELKLLNQIATSYKAVIDLLYISKHTRLSIEQEDHKNFVAIELSKNKVSYNTVDNKSITNAIYIYMKEHHTDLLVMVHTKHSFLENILFQSTVDKMSLHVDIPFLAMQNIRRYEV